MKHYIIPVLIILAFLMIGGYHERGYMAAGPEIMVVPLLIGGLVTYRKWKKGEAK